MLSDLVITQDQARSARESSSRWASLMLTVSVKGWMKSSESCKYVLGSKHSLPLKGKMLSGGEVLYLGFPGVVKAARRSVLAGSSPSGSWPGRWRPLAFCLALRDFCFPGRRKVAGRRGKHGEERSDEKKSFFRKTNWPSGNRAEGEDPNRTVSFKGLLGAFCRFSCLFVTLSTSWGHWARKHPWVSSLHVALYNEVSKGEVGSQGQLESLYHPSPLSCAILWLNYSRIGWTDDDDDNNINNSS